MAKTDSPGRLKRGDTSLDRPGFVFFRYHRGNERWLTPEKFEDAMGKQRVVKARRRTTQAHKDYMREYFSTYNHTDKQKAYRKEYYSREDVKARNKINSRRIYLQDPIKVHQRMIAWRKTNIQASLRAKLSKRIRRTLLRLSLPKTEETVALIGCSIEEFRVHIENQFEPGMSWENTDQWHIDHKIPLAAFDLREIENRKRAFHFSNCRPMWEADNLAKSDKIEGELFRGRDLRKANILPFQAA